MFNSKPKGKANKKQQDELVGCSLCGSLDDFDNILPCEGCHRLYHMSCAGLEKRPNLYLCPFYCNVKPTKPQPQQAIEIDDDGAFSDQTNEEEYREFSAEKKDKEKKRKAVKDANKDSPKKQKRPKKEKGSDKETSASETNTNATSTTSTSTTSNSNNASNSTTEPNEPNSKKKVTLYEGEVYDPFEDQDVKLSFSRESVEFMNKEELEDALKEVNSWISKWTEELGNQKEVLEEEILKVPTDCLPINGDVTKPEIWNTLFREFEEFPGAKLQFDVITMDPPWQLATATPTRGVAIGYGQLSNKLIADIPVEKLQKQGFLCIWVINARFQFALELFQKWGYTVVDDVAWVKETVNRRMAKGHGFYLQHAKETCLIGVKGKIPYVRKAVEQDIIFAERRGQSQKPEKMYEIMESLVPGGLYLEIFGRRNNLRDCWFTIGNEL